MICKGSRTPFLQRFSRLTDEFRNVVSGNLGDASKRPHQNALEAMLKVHRANREESFLYRLLDRPWLLPLSSSLEGLKAFSDQIEDKGVAAAATDLFQKMGARLEVTLAPEVREILEKKPPILLVGEHPSPMGFDYCAVAASLVNFWRDKSEPRLLAMAMVTGMCPGLRHSVFPVMATREETVRFLVEGVGAPKRLAQAWVPEVDRDEAHHITSSSLNDVVDYWLSGGHILIFPDGGAKGQHWFLGVGRIILEALKKLEEDRETDPYILFFYLNGAKDYLALNHPFMSRIHPARLILLGRKRITVRYQRFFRLRDCQDMFLAMNKGTLTHYLQKEYELKK